MDHNWLMHAIHGVGDEDDTPKSDEPTYERADEAYYEIEVTPMLRFALLDLIRGRRVRSDVLRVLEMLTLEARKIHRPFSRARLPWIEVEEEAARQGIGPADVIWDRAGKPRKKESQ
jgi:hypothetical protein